VLLGKLQGKVLPQQENHFRTALTRKAQLMQRRMCNSGACLKAQ